MPTPRLPDHSRQPKGPLNSHALMRHSFLYQKLLTEERRVLFDYVREFSQRELAPRTCDLHTGKMPASELPPLLKKFCPIGIPERLGGNDDWSGLVDTAILHQNLAYGSASAAAFFDVDGLFPFVLMLAGNEAQQAHYVPKIANGEIIGCYGLSDPRCASDVAKMSSLTFKRDGDSFVLNGSKTFITNGPIADNAIVFAIDPENPKTYKNVTAFVVPAKREGSNGFVADSPMDKIGWRASKTSMIFLDDVKVPIENVVGNIGEGFLIAVTSLAYGRINVAAEALGLMERVYDELIKFASDRPAVGADALCNAQVFHYQLSEIAQLIQATRDTIYNTALLAESRDGEGKIPYFAFQAAMAKSFAARSLQTVASRGVELHGGYGITLEYPISVIYSEAPIYRSIEGADNVLNIWAGATASGAK